MQRKEAIYFYIDLFMYSLSPSTGRYSDTTVLQLAVAVNYVQQIYWYNLKVVSHILKLHFFSTMT